MNDKRLSYLPGLDGLRALAVLAVLFFHAGQRWMPGGFLGVEVFFVISGYLITCVLLESREVTGSLGLRYFWLRRARRLLPALFALLLGTLATVLIFYPDEVAQLRVDVLAALGYVTNWYYIFDHQSYEQAVGRASLFQHLWSLAIEEQFYLIWPLVLALLVGRLGSRGMVGLLVVGALASSVLMALLWTPEAGMTRVYYGTDTRASGLLVGAALAFVWAPWTLKQSRARMYAAALNLAGFMALAAVIYLHVELDQYRSFLYHGGFALVSVTSAVVIAVAVHPSAHLGRLLGLQPLRWLGTRSYAVYLWHWPVFMFTRPGLDVSIDGWELVGLRLGVTFLLAEASYRLVEKPVRSGALGRAWRSFRDGNGLRRWAGGVRWGAPLSATAMSSAVLAVFAIAAEPPATPAYLSVESVHIISPSSAQAQNSVPGTTSIVVPPSATPDQGAIVSVPAGNPPGRPADAPAQIYGYAPNVAVTVVGDSVMVGAAQTLAAAIPGADIDAAIGRQAQTALDILQQRRSAQALGDAVIIHIGNNGTFTTNQFDAMMQALADRRVVIFVNVKVPRSWEEPNNEVIADGVHRYSNAALVDWHGASVDRPELFYDDGIHLQPAGVQLYASLITKELAAHPPPPPPPPPPSSPPPPDVAPADTPVPPLPPSPEPVPPTGTPSPTPTPGPAYPPTPTSPPTAPPPPAPPPPPPPPPPTPAPTPPPTPPPTPQPTPSPTPAPTPPPTPGPTPAPTLDPTPAA